MSRPLRIQFPGAVYHVMNRGAARRPTFIDDADYQVFLDTVAEAHRQWAIEVFAHYSSTPDLSDPPRRAIQHLSGR